MAGRKTHKAVQLVGFNVDLTKALAFTDQPTPSPGDDEVLIHMQCRPVNPSDIMVFQGYYPPFPNPTKFPVPLGLEGMGVVAEVGKNVQGLSVGQRVVPLIQKPGLTGQGSWQEFVVALGSRVFPVSDSVSNEVASQFFVNPWSVYALLEILQVPKGEYVIQSAASSAAGRQIIQYAHHIGVKTINLVRKDEQIAELKGLGADEVINYTTEDTVKRVAEITRGHFAYGAIDSAGGEVTKILTQTVRKSGTVILLGGVAGPIAEILILDLIFRDVKMRGFLLSDWSANLSPQELSHVASIVMALLEKKVLTPYNGDTFPLHRYADAIAKTQQTARGGKVFLVNE